MRLSFRNGFFGGAIVAVGIGVYLCWLWQPDRQVQLHTRNLIRQIETRDWPAVRDFLAHDYRDDWHDDGERLIERMREVLRLMRKVQIAPLDPQTQINGRRASWSSRIKVSGDDGEALAFIEGRINSLPTPFVLDWRRESAKPWDWKLVGVSNSALKAALDMRKHVPPEGRASARPDLKCGLYFATAARNFVLALSTSRGL